MPVEELQQSLSLNEWTEWLAYYSLYPFGRPTEDDNWRGLYQLLWSANSDGKTKMPDFINRDPKPEPEAPQGDMTLSDKIRMLFKGRAIRAEEKPESA